MSEWERLWSRKITWFILMVIPLIIYASAKYYQSHNGVASSDYPDYTLFGNFPIMALSEQLMTSFNLIVLILSAYLITEEYNTGQLRFIMLRSYKRIDLIWTKWLVLLTTLFIYLFVYFVLSYGIGYVMFERTEQVLLFYHQEKVNLLQALFYNLKYYGFAFLTLIVCSCMMFFIAIASRTTTGTIGIGVAILLFFFLYPTILQIFEPWINQEIYHQLYFTSLVSIQWQGIVLLLAEIPRLVGWLSVILSVYFLVFSLLSVYFFAKEDHWI